MESNGEPAHGKSPSALVTSFVGDKTYDLRQAYVLRQAQDNNCTKFSTRGF